MPGVVGLSPIVATICFSPTIVLSETGVKIEGPPSCGSVVLISHEVLILRRKYGSTLYHGVIDHATILGLL